MSQKKESKGPSRFAQLSGVGLQMGVTIFLGAYLGKYLDGKYPMDKKWWTIGLTITAVAIALYNVLRQLNRINSEDDKK
jgi:F0F1-type ATP synthase assembly protein I